LELPDDLEAFRTALCLEHEWNVSGTRQQKLGRERYAYAEISDKGRYLIEVLEHFEGVSEAFHILMHRFWRETLLSLGAVPVEKNEALRAQLLVTLRKRLGQMAGPLKFENEAQLDRLAREALRFGRMAGTSERLIDYKALLDKWSALVEEELSAEGDHHLTEDDKAYYRDSIHLTEAIQLVCQRKIFFQGREWKCRRCFNKNWTSIDELRGILVCEVCKGEAAAPVSGDWDFKPNNFIMSAYREHGVEPVIWTLWMLWQEARQSFYFAPSLKLWETYPASRGENENVELDAIAVVDGKLYLCEAKSSSGLAPQQVQQLISAAKRVRPDVLLISCPEKISSGMKNAAEAIRATLGGEIEVKFLELEPEMLESHSGLLG
jgi:hypothetical protein